MFFKNRWVYFSFIINWNSPDGEDPVTVNQFFSAIHQSLTLVKDTLSTDRQRFVNPPVWNVGRLSFHHDGLCWRAFYLLPGGNACASDVGFSQSRRVEQQRSHFAFAQSCRVTSGAQ
ncbi:MAG: hypothetical protein WDN00_11200 [Limisphaerales bacterium]